MPAIEDYGPADHTPRTAVSTHQPRHAPLAHVVCADVIEGVHYGSIVILSADGRVEFQAGDIKAAFDPNSALRPIQAVGMLRAGLSLEGELLALATGGHSGEDRHLAGVRRILAGSGLTEADLRNRPDWPCDSAVHTEWLRGGRAPSQLAHNASGMHAAMLMTARNQGWPLDSYLDREHPLQQWISDAVQDLTGETPSGVATDDCAAPAFTVSLRGLTQALARVAGAAPGTPEERIARAIREHPEMASGSWRDVARLMRAVPGLLAKDGFEGVQVAVLPDGRAIGMKIADGADRARMPVMAEALALCGVDRDLLSEFSSTPVWSGLTAIGQVRAAGALPPTLPVSPPGV